MLTFGINEALAVTLQVQILCCGSLWCLSCKVAVALALMRESKKRRQGRGN